MSGSTDAGTDRARTGSPNTTSSRRHHFPVEIAFRSDPIPIGGELRRGTRTQKPDDHGDIPPFVSVSIPRAVLADNGLWDKSEDVRVTAPPRRTPLKHLSVDGYELTNGPQFIIVSRFNNCFYVVIIVKLCREANFFQFG